MVPSAATPVFMPFGGDPRPPSAPWGRTGLDGVRTSSPSHSPVRGPISCLPEPGVRRVIMWPRVQGRGVQAHTQSCVSCRPTPHCWASSRGLEDLCLPLCPLPPDFRYRHKPQHLPGNDPAFSTEHSHQLPWRISGRESTCQFKRHTFSLWVEKITQRKKWQPTTVFLPVESHGQKNLEGYSPGGQT